MSRSLLENADQIAKKTISDFGEQWRLFRSNSGYYGDAELLQDIIFPFISFADIAGKNCAEIGAGTGRISLMSLLMGLLAEMLVRIYFDSEGRAPYHVRELINFPEQK